METLIKTRLPNWQLVAQEQQDTLEAVDNLWLLQNKNSHWNQTLRVLGRFLRVIITFLVGVWTLRERTYDVFLLFFLVCCLGRCFSFMNTFLGLIMHADLARGSERIQNFHQIEYDGEEGLQHSMLELLNAFSNDLSLLHLRQRLLACL